MQNLIIKFQRISQMKLILLEIALLVTCLSSMVQQRPDSILCGPKVDGSATGGVFILASTWVNGQTAYYQTYSGELRGVIFNGDGKYKRSLGRFEERQYCIDKTLSELETDERTFDFTEGARAKINDKESSRNEQQSQDISEGKEDEKEGENKQNSGSIPNSGFGFQDAKAYEDLKQLWYEQFKAKLFEDIKNGLKS